MDGLSILLSAGQLLGLPVVIYLAVSGRFTLVPLSMIVVLVVHFAPYGARRWPTPCQPTNDSRGGLMAALSHALFADRAAKLCRALATAGLSRHVHIKASRTLQVTGGGERVDRFPPEFHVVADGDIVDAVREFVRRTCDRRRLSLCPSVPSRPFLLPLAG